MAHRLRLVAVAALCVFGASYASAFYASPTPPPGFSGTPGNWTFAPPSGAQQVDKIIRQSGGSGLKVPTSGAPVSVPVGYRLKAQAARVAAAAVFANPYVRLAFGIAAWLGVAKVVWDSVNQTWHVTKDPLDLSTYYKTVYTGEQEFLTFDSACTSGVAALPGTGGWVYSVVSSSNNQCKYRQSWNGTVFGEAFLSITEHQRTVNGCPVGWTMSPAGCLSPALDQPNFVDKLAPPDADTMPQSVPGELPTGTPLPVDQPFFNPSPGANPASRPIFVPTGDPIANPDYDPLSPTSPSNQPYFQPGVRIVPSPTATEPWRVDVQPVNRPTDSPDPNPNPQPEPDPNNPDKPKPEEQQSLCEKHPDVVACAKTGTVEAVPVPNENKQLTINKDTGYGPESGTCPQPKTATVMGKTLSFKYDLLCDFSGQIKPIVIAFAWLSAALTFFGFSRKDS